MQRDFWLERWQRGEIGFHQNEINEYLKQYWEEISREYPGSRVFVPLCGKSLDMLWLRDKGHPVTGIELSKIAVGDFFEENRIKFDVTHHPKMSEHRTEGLSVLCGDFFDLNEQDLEQHHLVFDRAALIALPEEMRKSYADHLVENLPQSVSILQILLTYPQPEMNGPPFSVDETELFELYDNHFDISKLAEYDIFSENPKFRERGLTSLKESVFLLKRKAAQGF